MPPALLTTRRAVPADAETLVHTSRLGRETWRVFAPAGWTRREHDERIAFVREIVGHPHGVALLAHVPGEPVGHFAMVPGPGTSRARRRGWRADTLVEIHDGMPWPMYGRPLLPVAGAARENPAVDAGVRSRP